MEKKEDLSASRRNIASRNTQWARLFSAWLGRVGVRPNTISLASMFCAAISASGFALFRVGETPWEERVGAVAVILGILTRLLCNLFDGMVAVEGGFRTKSGEVFNDSPDRVSDLLIIVAMGFAAASRPGEEVWAHVGWLAGSLAVFTAYVRYLGAGCGTRHFFLGPMAKQHRMATTITATVATVACEPWLLPKGTCFQAGLTVMTIGIVITIFRRLGRIVRELEAGVGSKDGTP